MAKMSEHFNGELMNVHMRFTEQENDTGERDVTFLYEVAEGVAHRSYGLNVAKLAGLPRSLLEEANRRSKQMEEEEGRRRLGCLSQVMGSLMEDSAVEDLEHLVAGVEQM